MTDYKKYINALRKCAKEHENDRTSFGHIIVSDLCKDTANLLEELEQEPRWIPVSERLPKPYKEVIVTDIELTHISHDISGMGIGNVTMDYSRIES